MPTGVSDPALDPALDPTFADAEALLPRLDAAVGLEAWMAVLPGGKAQRELAPRFEAIAASALAAGRLEQTCGDRAAERARLSEARDLLDALKERNGDEDPLPSFRTMVGEALAALGPDPAPVRADRR